MIKFSLRTIPGSYPSTQPVELFSLLKMILKFRCVLYLYVRYTRLNTVNGVTLFKPFYILFYSLSRASKFFISVVHANIFVEIKP